VETLKRHLKAIFSQETGQALPEYGLLLALVTMAAVVGLGILGTVVAGSLLDFAGQLAGSGS
jgi:pilus assembly protein Flp/PilA